MKRILLFLLTNIAVLLVLSLVCSLLGVDRYLTARGLNLGMLLVFAAVMGMGGSFISLLMSKWLAKFSTGAEVLSQPRSAQEAWLLATVERLARAANIGTPEVAIYQAPEPNAFATGASRNHALVAVSTGLLQAMRQEEVEAVLGHEISHVANGDMVTLTLLQGVLNTFVIFLSRVIGYAVDNAMRRDDDRGGPGMGYFLVSMVLQVLLGFLATLLVCAFSRWREFHADAGGAHLAGKRKMVAALERLKAMHEPSTLPQNMAAFGIAGGIGQLFATHPPLEQRIARLQQQGQA
jgi:heat shock protein HtpX